MSIEFKNKDASGRVVFDLNANNRQLTITSDGQPVELSATDTDRLVDYLTIRTGKASPGATGGGFGG